MSSKLPTEILINIFQQLHQDDQHGCMLVSRRWYQVIERYVLYRTVFIYCVSSIRKLVLTLKKRPYIAKRIERVMLNTDRSKQIEFNAWSIELSSLLVNLKVLHCSSSHFSDYSPRRYSWCKQIEYISEESKNPMTYRLLTSDICPNLKTLIIRSDLFCSILVFKNAPFLTSLALQYLKINFDELELLHEYLPHLRSFKVDFFVYTGNQQSNKDITPSFSVTEFVTTVATGSLQLLSYITIKYPNLSSLTCCPVPKPFNQSQHSNTIGWPLLFQKLGPKIKKLCLGFEYHAEDLFGTLDKFACKISYLKLRPFYTWRYSDIAQSQQASYIQTLVLDRVELSNIDWLKNLVVLRKLKLINPLYNWYFRITDILKNASLTLESLSLESMYLDNNMDCNFISNIKTISFEKVALDNKVDTFSSRCFPKLSKLKLKYCGLRTKTINLDKLDIRAFYYAEKDSVYGSNRTVSIITLSNNERRLYRVNDHERIPVSKVSVTTFHPHGSLTFKSVPLYEINSALSNITLICNSFGKLVFE